MNDKNKTVEASLIGKTKALRDKLKDEVKQIENRLKIVKRDIGDLTGEKNDLMVKKRQLEPWLTRTEADLAKLEPYVQPTVGREEVLPTVKENRTVGKSSISVEKGKKLVEDKKRQTEVKNEQ